MKKSTVRGVHRKDTSWPSQREAQEKKCRKSINYRSLNKKEVESDGFDQGGLRGWGAEWVPPWSFTRLSSKSEKRKNGEPILGSLRGGNSEGGKKSGKVRVHECKKGGKKPT